MLKLILPGLKLCLNLILSFVESKTIILLLEKLHYVMNPWHPIFLVSCILSFSGQWQIHFSLFDLNGSLFGLQLWQEKYTWKAYISKLLIADIGTYGTGKS